MNVTGLRVTVLDRKQLVRLYFNTDHETENLVLELSIEGAEELSRVLADAVIALCKRPPPTLEPYNTN